ncbi:MAG: hypothetical protein HRT71_19265 [Flavobacteriales bacterium]|nr:hypothetical protein [Flavobacteriales bacterium]
MSEIKKRNKLLYIILLVFCATISYIEIYSIECWNVVDGYVKFSQNGGNKIHKLAYKAEQNFTHKENSKQKYIDGGYCRDTVSVAMDKRTVFGPFFQLEYAEEVNLNEMKFVDMGACFKQLKESLNKISFVIAFTNEAGESVFWKDYAI